MIDEELERELSEYISSATAEDCKFYMSELSKQISDPDDYVSKDELKYVRQMWADRLNEIQGRKVA